MCKYLDYYFTFVNILINTLRFKNTVNIYLINLLHFINKKYGTLKFCLRNYYTYSILSNRKEKAEKTRLLRKCHAN